MEVSGRKERENKLSTNKRRQQKILCQPCKTDGDTNEAEGFCETCNEFLCTSCLKAHRKLALTKNHVIKLQDEMPKISSTQTDPCSQLCPIHKAEVIKFYCEDHDSVACGDCMVINHKACSVKLVSDVSENYDSSNELEQIKKKIDSLQRELSVYKNDVVNDTRDADRMREKIKKQIKIFRQEINKYLDNAETDLLKKVDELKSEQVSKLKHLEKEFETFENEMIDCEKNIHQASEKINDLFVATKISQEKIKACHRSIKKLAPYDIAILEFVKSKENVELLTNRYPIGVIDAQKERRFLAANTKSLINAETCLINCLDIKDNMDRKNCWITGMAVISRDELLLVDYYNKCLKILDVKKKQTTSRYSTDGKPWDVASIDSKLFAVTITKGEIIFIKTNEGISKSHSIKVRQNCSGIEHRDRALVVSFTHPAAFQLLDMKGTIMKEFDISSTCSYPYYIALNNDNNCLHISDYMMNSLFEFTIDGVLKAEMLSDDMKSPRCLVITDDGAVVVCCYNTNDRLSMVTPTTREILPLPVKGVQLPLSVALSDDQCRIFVFDFSDEQIKVFDVI